MHTALTRIIIVAAAAQFLVGSVAPIHAAPGGKVQRPHSTPPSMAGSPMGGLGADLVHKLQLTPSQQRRLNILGQRYSAGMSTDFRVLQTTRDPGARSRAMSHVRAAAQKMQAGFMHILTPKQQKVFRQFIQERAAQFRQMHPMPGR